MTTIDSSNIIQNLWWNELMNMRISQAERDTAQSQVAAVAAVQGAFDAAVTAAKGNGDLSQTGRASAITAAGKRGLEKLAALSTPSLAALDGQIVAAARALRQAAAGPDATMVTELRAIETRSIFDRIDPLLAPLKYMALCENGQDDAACIAVENASGFAPLLKPQTIADGQAIRGARSLPDQARALDVATDLRAVLASSVAAAQRHMSVGAEDPLVVAARGNASA